MAVVPFRDPQADADRRNDLGDEPGGKMSFLEHLDELRKRLLRCIIAIAIGIAIGFFFIDPIYEFVMVPLQEMLPEGNRLIATEPTEPFLLKLKIAFLAGLIAAAPAITYQVWMFVAPGLYANEKRFAIPFITLMTVGFVGGAAFSHYVVFPAMWRFLASFDNEFLLFSPRIAPTFSLYVRMVLATAVVFQLPTFVFALARMGVVTAKWMLKQFKYALLLNFVVAAIVTPSPDPVSQLLIALPMCALYIVSIGIAWVFGRRREPEA